MYSIHKEARKETLQYGNCRSPSYLLCIMQCCRVGMMLQPRQLEDDLLCPMECEWQFHYELETSRGIRLSCSPS